MLHTTHECVCVIVCVCHWLLTALVFALSRTSGVESTAKGVGLWYTAGMDRSCLPSDAPPRYSLSLGQPVTLAPLDALTGVRVHVRVVLL